MAYGNKASSDALIMYFHSFIKTDTESPQVQSCPTETMIQEATRFPYVLEWTEPTFTDNVGLIEVLRGEQPGKAVFTWGLFTVKYSAFDAAGNVAECIININVIRRKFESTENNIVLNYESQSKKRKQIKGELHP